MSKIIQLQAENVKRLKAVSVTPNGNVVVVGGGNGNGKTSLLDSIAYALGGKDAMPAEPLRRGAENGHVVLELDDGIVVKRTLSPGGGGSLTVTNKDGARFGTPQKILDGLVGKLSFDPLSFSRMPAKEQASTLRELVGYDTRALDAKRQEEFNKRRDINREVERLKGALSKLPPVADGIPSEEVSIDDLAADLDRRRAANASKRDATRDLESLRANAIAMKKHIEELEDALAKAKASLEKVTTSGKAQAAKVAAMRDVDENEVIEKLKTIQATNAIVRAAAERRKLDMELKDQSTKSQELTDAIAKIDTEKKEKLAAAKMPIEGLGFDENGVTLNGLPIEQASSAEQLRASVAIGLTMHPKLKVLLVRDGSLLDEKSLAMVAEMAAKADAQVWVEKVGKGQECQVVIEDGMVLEDRSGMTQGNAEEKEQREQDWRDDQAKKRNGTKAGVPQ